MKTRNVVLAFMLGIGLFFTACQKENSPVDLADLVTSEDVTTANNLVQDTEDEIDTQLETRDAGDNDCPTITVEPDDGSFPRTVTIDYGQDGCEGPHGRIRKGIILIEQSDTMKNEGATRTVTFVDFSVDDVQIEGTKTLTNEGFDDNGNVTFTRTADITLTFPNGSTASWEASHTLTQIKGGDTPQRFDDVFAITGGASGVNRNGKEFTVEIIQPLVKKKSCPWVVAGIKEVTVGDKTTLINYGDGHCDRKAIVTLPNGVTKIVLIHKWW